MVGALLLRKDYKQTSTGKISAMGTYLLMPVRHSRKKLYLFNNIPQLEKSDGTYWNNETKNYVYGGNTDRTTTMTWYGNAFVIVP